jgi:hypothetical protein
MPTAPLRKRLLRGAFAYAKHLQELRHRVLNSRLRAASSASDLELDLNIAEPIDRDNDSESDSSVSSLSSLSSLSSISSLSSLSSVDLEMPVEADIPQALPLDDTSTLNSSHSDSDYEEDL